MKKTTLTFLLSCILIGFSVAQDKLYLVFEFMKVDNEQERAYAETESFWEKIHEQRIKSGDIIGWDLWSLQPGGEDQGYQYMTVNLYNDPVKMMSRSIDGNFMDRVKAAYPDMSEEELDKRFNYTAKTRDLAVRIYLEQIDETTGDFEMAVGTVASIDMMKVRPGSRGRYEKAESEVFKPLHQSAVENGTKGNWGFLRIMSPAGSDTYASHITVNMYKDYAQFFKNQAAEMPNFTEDQTKSIEMGLATRDMKYSYMATLIKAVR